MIWPRIRIQLLYVWHLVLMLALVAVVSLAVFVALARQIFPLVDQWRPDLAHWLSAKAGVPITLAELSARLDGFSVEIHLRQVQLHTGSTEGPVLLQIPDIEIRPALWQSIWHLEPRVVTQLRGVDIHLEQLADGRLQLRELASLPQGDAAAARRAIRMIFRQPALAVLDSRTTLALQGYPVLQLSGLSLVNTNEGDQHRLAGSVYIDGSREAMQLNIALQGDVLNWQSSQVDGWINVPVRTLDAWLPQVDVAGFRLQALTGGGEYWFHLKNGQLQGMEARPNWSVLTVGTPKGALHVKRLRGELSLRRHENRWQIAAQQLRGELEGRPWPLPIMAMQVEESAIQIALQQVVLDNLPAQLERFSPSTELTAWLKTAAPGGFIKALRVDLAKTTEASWGLSRLELDAHRLHLKATEKWPGAEGLSGWAVWTPQQAWLGLDTRNALLDLAQVFREPVVVQQLQGQLRLRQREQDWVIDSSVLKVRNSDATGQAVAHIHIPRADPSTATLSLRARLHQGRVASAWRYVPWPQAGDKALAWLREALQGGVVTQGDFLVEGAVHHREDLPPLTVQMQFDVEQGRLNYAPEWPVLRDINGQVYIEGHELAVMAKQVRLLEGSQGQRVTARIPDLKHPVLNIDGDVSSTGPDLMRLFQESPLRHMLGEVPEVLALEGALAGHLKLDIPIHDEHGHDEHAHVDPIVDVTATLPSNRLHIKSANLVADGVKGNVSFSTAEGLRAERLQASLLGEPVTATISSVVRQNELANVQVAVGGHVSVAALRQWLGGGLWRYASGSAPYQVQVNIPTHKARASLQVSSSLAGLRVTAPSPFGKGPEPRAFSYQSPLGGDEQKAVLRYGNSVVAGLDWKGDQLQGALFRLTDNATAVAAEWPLQDGLEIEGSLPRLDIRPWMPWIQQDTGAASTQSGLPELKRLQIKGRELLSDQARLSNVSLGVAQTSQGWLVAVSSNELVGAAQWPEKNNENIQLSFSHLVWPLPQISSKKTNAMQSGVTNVSGHPIQIQGEGLKLRDYAALGIFDVEALILPSPSGLHVKNIQLKNPIMGFSGEMDWQWRGGTQTHLKGVANSQNVGGLLQAFGYAPSLISERATGDIDLAWQGAPDAFDTETLDGNLKLTLLDGRLLNVSNTTSASRVLGWFDLDNIKRRFKGDFSDVTRRGLGFDTAELSGDIQGGMMPSAKLAVMGPSIKVHGQGKVDLAKQTLDQELSVVLPVTSAVPVAALVVGGPIVGGAVAAAHMVLEKQIDKATQIRYHVTGIWADPKVERTTAKAAAIAETAPATSKRRTDKTDTLQPAVNKR